MVESIFYLNWVDDMFDSVVKAYIDRATGLVDEVDGASRRIQDGRTYEHNRGFY